MTNPDALVLDLIEWLFAAKLYRSDGRLAHLMPEAVQK